MKPEIRTVPMTVARLTAILGGCLGDKGTGPDGSG
jgi:hypothetical protein